MNVTAKLLEVQEVDLHTITTYTMEEYALLKVNGDNATLQRKIAALESGLSKLSLLQTAGACDIQKVEKDALKVDHVGEDLDNSASDMDHSAKAGAQFASTASQAALGIAEALQVVGNSVPGLSVVAGVFGVFDAAFGISTGSRALDEEDVKNVAAEMMSNQGEAMVELLNQQIGAVSNCVTRVREETYNSVVYFNVLSDVKSAENALAAVALMPRDKTDSQAVSLNEALLGCMAASNYEYWMKKGRSGAFDEPVAHALIKFLPVLNRWHTSCKAHSMSLLALVALHGAAYSEDYVFRMEIQVADRFKDLFQTLENFINTKNLKVDNKNAAEPYRVNAANHANLYHQLKLHKDGCGQKNYLKQPGCKKTNFKITNGKASKGREYMSGQGEVYPYRGYGGTECVWTEGTCRKCEVVKGYKTGGMSQGSKEQDEWYCWEHEAFGFAAKKKCVQEGGYWSKNFKYSKTYSRKTFVSNGRGGWTRDLGEPCVGTHLKPTTTQYVAPPRRRRYTYSPYQGYGRGRR